MKINLLLLMIFVAASSCTHHRITQHDIESAALDVVLHENIGSLFEVTKVERISGLSIHLQVLAPEKFQDEPKLYVNLLGRNGAMIETMARAFYNIHGDRESIYVNIRDYDESSGSVKTIQLVGDWSGK